MTTAAPTTLAPTTTLTTTAPTTAGPTTESFLTTVLATTPAPTTLWSCEAQDFTEYSQRGASNLGITAHRIEWENLRVRTNEARVYEDYEGDYFTGDFEHQFEFSSDYASGAYVFTGIWGLSNYAADKSSWAGPFISLSIQYYHTLHIEIYHATAGIITRNIGGIAGLDNNTTYYARIIRDESIGTHGQLIVQIFTDAARTNLKYQEKIDLYEKDDYRYLYAFHTELNATSLNYRNSTSSGHIANLCIWDEVIHGALTTAAPTTAGPTTEPPTLAPTTLPPTVVAATIPCCTFAPRTFVPTTELPSSKDMPVGATICSFNGQIIMGNIMSSWYDCYENSVAWSDIGHSDFTLDESQNIAGYMHMPWEGEVLRVFRLGNFVMVYGDNGTAALQPVIDPEPTFGLVELDTIIGLAGREAWCGNFQRHYFVDRAGSLWEINSKLELKKHDYREYLAPLLASGTLVLSLNEADNEVYISNGTSAYIKTPQGLTATYQLVKSMRFKDGTLYATLDEAEDDSVEIETDIFDMGFRGLKTLTTVEVGLTQEQDDTENVEVAIKWRSNKTSAFTQTGWQVVNPQGVLTFFVTAAEFKVLMRCATFNDIKVDYLNVRYKASDRRSQRGANPGQVGKETSSAG